MGAGQAVRRSDVASQPDGDLQRGDQDRNASKAWAMRMPTLRTMKNAVMASNMQISCASVPQLKRQRICTVKNNFIECECPHSPDVFLQQNLVASYAAHGPNIVALVRYRPTRIRCRTRRRRREKMKTNESDPEDVDWASAEAALAAPQQMPGGPERIAALKKAALLRFKAAERRRSLRDQEPASNSMGRHIKAQRLLART